MAILRCRALWKEDSDFPELDETWDDETIKKVNSSMMRQRAWNMAYRIVSEPFHKYVKRPAFPMLGFSDQQLAMNRRQDQPRWTDDGWV